jgi:RNA polymerase sigma-70 factor (ECF subfamily)
VEDPAGPSDAELVTRVLAGDEDLFGVLVDRYKLRLFRFVSRYLGDPEDARDVTQEVFFKIYSALDSYDPKYRFSTWAFRIAGNAAIDHLRRRRIRAIPLQFPADDESEGRKIDPVDGKPDSGSPGRASELSTAIERLPDDYRELISLRHHGELAYEEIAELKGMPLGTVKNKLFRARQALRDLLPKGTV